MKYAKRLLCILLAVCMIVTFVPPITGNSYASADSNINIPISLDGTSQTRGMAMAKTLEYKNSGTVNWKHPSSITELGELLESTKTEDKYISLTQDLENTWKHHHFDGFTITKDKVLDLNGHTVKFHIDTNLKPWSYAGIEQAPYQRPGDSNHIYTCFIISGKQGEPSPNVYILDSTADGSNSGKGGITVHGRIEDPFKDAGDPVDDAPEHNFDYYTNYDLFEVLDGNLIIYGGNYQAGRSKAVVKDNFSWSKVKTAIGKATELAVSVANYATGIEAAVAASDDVMDSFNKLKNDEDVSSTKLNKNEVSENKTKDPDKKEIPKTVGDKQDDVDKSGKANNSQNGEQKSNDKESAKSDKNSKIAEAHKKVVDSVLDQSKIEDITGKVFGFCGAIAGMLGSAESTRIIYTHFGTCVYVANKGTFVSYGGTYNGFGSSPNTRNAVVEATRNGKAYIYGGTFNARSGANVFNIVKTGTETVQQTNKDKDGNITYKTVEIKTSENHNHTEIMVESDGVTPVDTSNILVRGGTFRNYYEAKNIGLKGEGDAHFSTWYGTPGAVNLGLGSYGEDFIKDGRIQIVDLFGDGALVLMDENSGGDGKLYHYRLFCSDLELRYKQGIRVYPNNAKTNTTNSFALKTQNQDGDTSYIDEVLSEKDGNIRGAYNSTEKVFYFPLNSSRTEAYRITPTFNGLDPDGETFGSSSTWYYQDPTDTEGTPIEPLVLTDNYISGTLKSSATSEYQTTDPSHISNSFNSALNTSTHTFGNKTYVDKRTVSDTSSKNLSQVFDSYSENRQTYNYLSNMKWIEYKVYQVDPLTRQNIGRNGMLGDDQPLATAVYGSDTKQGLKIMIRLTDLEEKIKAQNIGWRGFRQGEMYRITLNVEERLNHGYYGYDLYKDNASYRDTDFYTFNSNVGTAKASSSVLFMCYGQSEQTVDDEHTTAVADFTPLQWTGKFKAGGNANIEFVNAATGNVDWETNRIFDVYYQWWVVDEKGKEQELIAGTTNVWDIAAKYKQAKEQNLNDVQTRALLNKDKDKHSLESWLRGKDGFQYKNSLAPDDPLWNAIDRNGKKVNLSTEDCLPVIEYNANGSIKEGTNMWPNDNDQCSRLIHAYSTQWKDEDHLKLWNDEDLDNKNNNIWYGHYDNCYLPPSTEGKLIKVKAYVVNVNWTDYYDAVQIFESHPLKVGERVFAEDVGGSISLNYGGKGNYASIDNIATISLDKVTGLAADEYVTDVQFLASANNGSFKYANFKLKKGDELPIVQFPTDFFSEKELAKGNLFSKVKADDYQFDCYIITNLDNDNTWRMNWTSNSSGKVTGRLEVEVEKVKPIKDSYTFDIDDIKNGKYNSGEIQLFKAQPVDHSLPLSCKGATSTAPEVAYIEDDGTLGFGGSAGTAVLSYTDLLGDTHEISVTVIDYVDDIEIYGIDPPEIGKTFDNSVEIPDTADYHVKEIYWINQGSGERLDSSATARNYKTYQINVVVEKNDPSLVFKEGSNFSYNNFHPFTLYANTVEGDIDVVNGSPLNGYIDYVEDSATGEYKPGDTCTLTYTYYSAIGAAPGIIDTIDMNYPTVVKEGDSVDEWMDEFTAGTNGDDSEFSFKKGFEFTSFAEQTFQAYGYKVNIEDPTDTMKAFMKGTVNGPRLDIDLNPEKDGTAEFAAVNDITVNVNGETNENTDITIPHKQHAFLTVPNTITIEDGKVIPVLPKYRVKDFNLELEEEVCLDDYLETEGNIKLILDISEMEEDQKKYFNSQNFDYDEANNILTLLSDRDKNGNVVLHDGDEIRLPLYVTIDGDGDGVVDMRVNHTVTEKLYIDNSAPKPDNGTDIEVYVKAIKPDGTTAYNKTIYANRSSDGKTTIDVPEVDGYFMTEVKRTRNPEDFKYEFTNWAGRIVGDILDADSITVYLTDAADVTIKKASTEIYPEFKGVDNLCVSLDGDHWTASKVAFVGLEPDTEYLLYYRQGLTDVFYTKVVKTDPAGEEYGVYVGRNPVTEADLGDLERDGYHYDPDTKTLTLKNFSFSDMGIDVDSFKLFWINRRVQSVIYSKDDITIELIGDNYLKKTGGESEMVFGNIIRSKGNITITGPGNLNLEGAKNTQAIQPGKGKNIYLKGSGKQSFSSCAFGYYPDGGKVYYENGEIYWDGDSGSDMKHNIIADDVTVVTTNAKHSYKIYGGKSEAVELSGLRITSEDADRIEAAEGTEYHKDVYYMHLVPQHSFTQQTATEEYYVSGDCSKGTTYYKSCSCGAADHDNTFTVAAGSHSLVHHDGKAATCIEDGYKAYDTCSKCDYSTFQLIPAKGHTYVHHDEKLPTCEEDGYPAYDECTVCGYSSLDLTIQAAMKAEGTKAAQEVERDDLWVATGHDLIYVPGTAPETCTNKGVQDHYECTHCGETFADEFGVSKVEAADLEIAAVHSIVMVEPKAATKTEDGNIQYYVCEECGKFFNDAEGKNEIKDHSSVIIPATGTPAKPSINYTKKTLKAGKTVTLKITNGTVKSWKSSKATIAKVSTKGVVTALTKGTATITATLKDGTKKTCKITVSTNPTITVGGKKFKSTTTYKVKKGKYLTVKITGRASSVPNVYSTTKKTIAKVTTTSKKTSTVKIKGLKVGSCTVTIKVNGKAFKIKVKVTK